MTWRRRAVALSVAALAGALQAQSQGLSPEAPPRRAAFFVRSLDNPRERQEARPEILDAPMFPGSVAKVVSLVAALESGAIHADSSRLCRRETTTRTPGGSFSSSAPALLPDSGWARSSRIRRGSRRRSTPPDCPTA